MAFNGDEGKMIDAGTAQQWINNYAKRVGPDATKAHFVGFRRLSELMGQGNAIGVRIYYATDDQGTDRLVIVAVSPEEKNIARIDGSATDGLVLDDTWRCPPYCNNVD